MGDFNMSKQDVSQFLSKYNLSWNILDLTGHQLTWSRGGHTSCIEHRLANDKIMEFINQSSVCTSFNDLSDYFPIILSFRKIDNEGFVFDKNYMYKILHECKKEKNLIRK